jgi:hypothetical protein
MTTFFITLRDKADILCSYLLVRIKKIGLGTNQQGICTARSTRTELVLLSSAITTQLCQKRRPKEKQLALFTSGISVV